MLKTNFLLFLLSSIFLPIFGQDNYKIEGIVEKNPVPLNMDEVKRAIGYPGEALKKNASGVVYLRVLINEKGEYENHNIIQSPDIILTQAVESHIAELRFSPAIQKGDSIKFWVTVPFSFIMEKGGARATKSYLDVQGLELHVQATKIPNISVDKFHVTVTLSKECKYESFQIRKQNMPETDLSIIQTHLEHYLPDLLYDCYREPVTKEKIYLEFWKNEGDFQVRIIR